MRTPIVSSRTLSRRWFRGFVGVITAASLAGFIGCGGGDNGGGGGGGGDSNPPPAASANQFAAAIYAATSTVQGYKLDGDGNLTAAGPALFTGDVPVHVNVDPRGRFVYVSNRDANFLSGYLLGQDGILTQINPASGSPVTNVNNGTNPPEEFPHASVTDQTGEFLYVVAGSPNSAPGPSTLKAYKITTSGTNLGTLTPVGGDLPAGVNARSIAISPNNQFVYVASEGPAEGAPGSVHAFARQADGTLAAVGTPFTAATLLNPAAVTVHPSNQFVYVGYTNAVELFQIGNDGSLTRVNTFPTNQSGPRSIALGSNGTFLYAANVNSSTITAFQIDPATGALTELSTLGSPYATGADPTSIVVHPNGKFLYTADNVADQVSRLPINADGSLGPAVKAADGDGANGIGTTNIQ